MNKYIAPVIDAITTPGTNIIKVTKFVSPTEVVRAVRRTYSGKIAKGNIEIVLTIGKPNYAERAFVASCKKAKESFPLKKLQLKYAKTDKK